MRLIDSFGWQRTGKREKYEKKVLAAVVFGMTMMLAGCSQASEKAEAVEESTAEESVSESVFEEEMSESSQEEEKEMRMNVQIGEHVFTASLENNDAVNALVKLMEKEPITIQMSDYGGFEKVGGLGTSLPASNRQTTTQAGDIVLYQGSQIVMFYGSNSWSYTRLGRITDLTGWQEASGSGGITVTFSLEK